MRIIVRALVLVFSFPLQGCIGYYRYCETQVTVTDCQSNEPVAGIQLESYYSCDLPGLINMPRTEQVVTDEQGTATMSIATWWDSGITVENCRFTISRAFLSERRNQCFLGHDAAALAEPRELELAVVTNQPPPIRVFIAPVKKK